MLTSYFEYCLVAFAILLSSTTNASEERNGRSNKWGTIWSTAPQLVEPANLPPQPFNISGAILANTTLRQTIKITLGAPRIQLRFSNAFGSKPYTIDSVAIGLPVNGTAGGSSVKRGSSKAVTFNGGQSFITIPRASSALSDPISIPLERGQVVTISVYLKEGVGNGALTGHPGSRTDSWLAFGNQVDKAELGGVELLSTAHWYLINCIEGWVPASSKYLSIIGDSITDGRGSTTNQNNRWPDQLSTSLASHPSTSQIAIGNQGLGGNCLLSECLGPNGLSRFDRGVLTHSGVTHALIFEGVNDIGTADPSPAAQKAIGDSLINAHRQFIVRVHAAGLSAIGATITPFGGSFYDEGTGERQRTRTRVNEWIRKNKGGEMGFDAVVDFDQAVRDPRNVTVLRSEFDSGDGLHPNPAAYVAFVKTFSASTFDY